MGTWPNANKMVHIFCAHLQATGTAVVHSACYHLSDAVSLGCGPMATYECHHADIISPRLSVLVVLQGFGPMPEKVVHICCGQFAATKQAIRHRDRQFYQEALLYMRPENNDIRGNHKHSRQYVVGVSAGLLSHFLLHQLFHVIPPTLRALHAGLLFFQRYTTVNQSIRRSCMIRWGLVAIAQSSSWPDDSQDLSSLHLLQPPLLRVSARPSYYIGLGQLQVTAAPHQSWHVRAHFAVLSASGAFELAIHNVQLTCK